MLTKMWLRALAIILFSGCVFSRNTPNSNRIVGGKDTTIEAHPYQLSLEYYGVHFCGASLISDTFVVTAAHCTEEKTADVLSIRAGTSIRNYEGVIVGIEKIIDHPNYDSETVDYDISVLKLATKLKLGPKINIAKLIDEGVDVTGKKAVVTGWGKLYENGDFPSDLQELEVPILSHDECEGYFGEGEFTKNMMCAGYLNGGRDSCQGDSGGPLVINKNVLVGVVSWGDGCARPRKPGIYAKVSIFRKFIRDSTGL